MDGPRAGSASNSSSAYAGPSATIATPTSSNGSEPSGCRSVSTFQVPPMAIHWEQLSPTTIAYLRQVATRLVDGFSAREIANELGTSTYSMNAAREHARQELAQLPSESVIR